MIGLDRAQLLALIANIPPTNYPAPKFGEQPYIAYTQGPGPSSHPPAPPEIEVEEGGGDDMSNDNGPSDNKMPPSQILGGRRSRNGATMGSDEWTRKRNDKNREVERRRRGNINEGINELGRIVPTGSGENAQAAILSRAVQYILHLKDNEARNIDKWTLEKLLIDRAIEDVQAQLEEMRRLWEEERINRMRLELELETSGKGIERSDDEAKDAKDKDSNKRERSE